VDPAIRAARSRAARHELWRRGEIWRIYFDRNQLADHHKLWSRPAENFCLDVSRQTGKSWFMLVEANCFAIQHPGSRIPYASLTQKSILEIIEPAMARLIEDAPKDVAPRHDKQRNAWEWPVGRGSYMVAAGTDNKHYTSLRGSAAHLIIKDEAGFFEDPAEVDAVLSPQTLTTGGITISGSTPPVSPGHPWTKYCLAMRAAGRHVHRTIWEHGRLSRAQIEQYLRKVMLEAGFADYAAFLESSTYKREYLAMHVVDETRAVVPEWTMAAPKLTQDVPRPRWFYPGVGFDVGWRDGMAGVFGYWHFAKAAAVVEDEMLLFNVTTPRVAQELRRVEQRWLPKTMPKPYTEATHTPWGSWRPFARWMDPSAKLTLNDLAAHDGLDFTPTRNDEKELQINELRKLVNSGRLLINPKCERLISQLGSTIWNKQRSSYERTEDGHGDLIDALVYFLRNLPRNVNPEPPFWDADPRKQWIPEHDERSEEEQALSGAFS
jgi:hypothetical protein